MTNEHCVWVGPVVASEDVKKYSAVSPAGNKWQMNFIESLKVIGISIEVVSYLPMPFFPHGALRPYYKNRVSSNISQVNTSYWNLPGIRNRTLGKSVERAISKLTKLPTVLFTYNSYPPHILAATKLKQQTGLTWVNVIADGEDTALSDCSVYLSYHSYSSSKLTNKHHCDGGVYGFPSPPSGFVPESNTESQVIVFAGALNKWTGIFDLIDLLNRGIFQKFPRLRLRVFGKGEHDRMLKFAKNNSQIDYAGFVSEQELENALSSCFAFVNPRPDELEGNEGNFPSKLFDYLKYSKPIISTRTKGLSPVYDSVLLMYQSATELEKQIGWLLRCTSTEYENLCQKHYQLAMSLNWRTKVENLMKSILGR